MNNRKRLFVFWVAVILLAIGIVTMQHGTWRFYFTATLEDHKKWFPRFHIISYSLLKAHILLLTGISLFLIVDFLTKKLSFVFSVIRRLPFSSFFLFALYIPLSLVLPEYYPLSKYPMYNSWGREGAVFSLRDNNNKLIPLNKISKINGAKLSHIYSAEKRERVSDSLAGKKMMEFLKANRNKSSMVRGEVSINKTILLWDKSKIYTNEIQLYKDTME